MTEKSTVTPINDTTLETDETVEPKAGKLDGVKSFLKRNRTTILVGTAAAVGATLLRSLASRASGDDDSFDPMESLVEGVLEDSEATE